ncbi:hypothetical protein KCP74_03080 [Salmonella enterica subsp. enterica]|nr:hypothetical protein KCP74_03080 [Salmonella enterica subsp. enterica]
MPDGSATFYPAYDYLPSLQTGRNINPPQRISCYRKAASEHTLSSIVQVHFILAGARECGQHSAKDFEILEAL